MRFLLATLLGVSLWGCSTSYVAAPTGGDGRIPYSTVNATVSKEDVIVLLRDGTEYPARHFAVDSASAIWKDPATGEAKAESLGAVRSVRTVTNRTSAIFTGAIGGLVVGVVVGAKIGSTTMTGEDRQLGAAIGLAVGGAGGLLLGGGIGAVTARSIEFIFDEPGR